MARNSAEGSPTIAVVIPTLNSARTLAACLDSLISQDVRPNELVIVDDVRTKDETRSIGESRGARVVVSTAGMADSRNVGVAYTSSEVILHLDSDMIVEPGLIQTLVELFREDDGPDAATVAETSVGTGYWWRARALDKAGVEATGFGRSARVCTRELFDRVGGYDGKLEAGEDADFHRRALSAGARVAHLKQPRIVHDDGQVSLMSAFRKKRGYGLSVAAFDAKHGTGSLGQGWVRRMVRAALIGIRTDPMAVPGLVTLKLADAAGALVGMLAANSKSGAKHGRVP